MSESKPRKDARFAIRCTADEKEAWRKLAESRRIPIAQLFALGIQAAQGHTRKLDSLKLYRDVPDYGLKIALSRIGNNLNQLVKDVNTSLRRKECPDWYEALDGVFAIREQLDRVSEIALSISDNHDCAHLPDSIAILDYLSRNPSEHESLLGKILAERKEP